MKRQHRRRKFVHPLFVFIGPSGCGKTTLSGRLPALFAPEIPIKRICSCTTRPPREGEVDGVSYHFLTEEEFRRGIQEGEFIEHVNPFGSAFYGRRYQDLEPLRHGPCYADMTEHGVRALRASRRVKVVCIRVVAKGQALVRDGGARVAGDAARARIRIHIDHVLTNSHEHGGLEEAVRTMQDIVASYIDPS